MTKDKYSMETIGQKFIFALCLLGLLSCGPESVDQSSFKFSKAKILNGQKAGPDLFKQVVGLSNEGEIFCSATALKKRLLFSSSHCFLDFDTFEIEDEDDAMDFDNLFGSLGRDFCHTFKECEGKVDKMFFKAKKRRYLDDHFEAILKNLKKGVTIYQGEGLLGGFVKGEDIIKSVTLHPGWVRLVQLKLYQAFGALSLTQRWELKKLSEFDEYAFDFSQITLIKDVDAEEFIHPLKEEILEDGEIPDGSKLVLIGFGHQSPLEEVILQSSSFGVKMYAELPLSGIIMNKEGIFAVAGGENLGSCEGDSGGAALIKFPSGELKYLGIITAGGDRCGEVITWDNGGNMVQGNTIINVQLNTEKF